MIKSQKLNRIIRNLTWLLVLFLVIPYSLTCFCYHNSYHTQPMSRNLVVKKDGTIVGYIKGSIHLGLVEEDFEADREQLARLYPEVEKVFLETDLPAWQLLPYGMERIILESAEKHGKKEAVYGLERFDSQLTMLGSLYSFWGKIYYIPYGNWYETHPQLAGFCNVTMKILSYPSQVVYLLCHPEVATEQMQQQSQQMAKMREQFLNGQAVELSSEEIACYRIVLRDKTMYENLQKIHGSFSAENKFLLVIGVAHLTTQEGILALLMQDGYTIEELV